MRTVLVLATAAAVAALVLTTASAGPPPPLSVRIAVTREQAAAGRLFTGLAFTPVGGARIAKVACDARIGHDQLRGRQQNFYAGGVSGPAAVTCGWHLPAGASGKWLRLSGQDGRAYVSLVQADGQPSTVGTPVLSWHIRP